MKGRARSILFALSVGALVALGLPLGELWYKCLEPTSEGCVWGKALLPFSLAAGALLGVVAAALAYVVALAVRRRPTG